MLLLRLQSILNRWGLFFFTNAISILAMLVIANKFSSEDLTKVNINDKAELISWIYAGIMALVALLTIFVTFAYEHKLIAATEILNSIYKPYTLSLEELRQGLIKYKSLTSKNILLNFIYFLLLFLSIISIIVWGVIILIYCKFSIPNLYVLNLESIIDLGLYSLWLLLTIFFITILFIINQSRNNKNPLDKGYLPKAYELSDLDYLSNQDIDITEYLFKTCPEIELYSNPIENDQNSYEINIYFPIIMKNYRYVINIFDQNHDVIFKCYGKILSEFEIGVRHKESLYIMKDAYNSLNESSYGEIKIYNTNLDGLARIKIYPDIKKESITFTAQRNVKISPIDNDKTILQYGKKTINIQYEKF